MTGGQWARYRAADDLNLTAQQVADAAAAQAEADYHHALTVAAAKLTPCQHETITTIRSIAGPVADYCDDCGVRQEP